MGIQTGSGKTISIDPNKMKKAALMFAESDNEKNSNGVSDTEDGFANDKMLPNNGERQFSKPPEEVSFLQTGSGKAINVDRKKMERAMALFKDSNDEMIIETTTEKQASSDVTTTPQRIPLKVKNKLDVINENSEDSSDNTKIQIEKHVLPQSHDTKYKTPKVVVDKPPIFICDNDDSDLKKSFSQHIMEDDDILNRLNKFVTRKCVSASEDDTSPDGRSEGKRSTNSEIIEVNLSEFSTKKRKSNNAIKAKKEDVKRVKGSRRSSNESNISLKVPFKFETSQNLRNSPISSSKPVKEKAKLTPTCILALLLCSGHLASLLDECCSYAF